MSRKETLKETTWSLDLFANDFFEVVNAGMKKVENKPLETPRGRPRREPKDKERDKEERR